MVVRFSRYILPANRPRPSVSSTNNNAPTNAAAVPPPGSAQTPSASSRTIATLRAVFTARKTPATAGARRRRRGADRARRPPASRPRPPPRLPARAPPRRGLRREAVADPEVRVDVAPLRRGALELLAQLAHEDVDAAVAAGHGVAPDALVDLLALEHPALGRGEQLDQLELAAREVDRAIADEGLELIGADLHLAGLDRRRLAAPLGAPAPAHDGLDAGDDLLGMARLADPVVGAQPQPAHALGDGGLARADNDAEAGKLGAQALQPAPALRPDDGEIDDDGAQAHRHDRVRGHGAADEPVLPAEALEALGQDLEESRIPVQDRNAQRGAAAGRVLTQGSGGGKGAFRHVAEDRPA